MTTENNYSSELNQILFDYWAYYYRDLLAIPNWEEKANYRLQEEQTALRQIEHMERFTGLRMASHQKILVVGAGTGAEFMALSRRGGEVHGLEPDLKAAQIAHRKAAEVGLGAENFILGVGESLPYPDNTFDWVWCWTVLEHVQDVEKCILEMVRVTRPGGRICIQTPDYRQFYEAHYKLHLPMSFPRGLVKSILRWKGRPNAFVDTLQLVNSRQLSRIFQGLPLISQFILYPWDAGLPQYAPQNPWVGRIRRYLEIQQDQFWILYKL